MATSRWGSLIVDSLRAHAMRFASPLAPAYAGTVGRRILLGFAGVGLGFFLLLRWILGETGWRGSSIGRTLFVVSLLAVFLIVHRTFVRTPLADIGFRRWADWTRLERLYLAQVVPLAGVGFAIVFREHLRRLLDIHGVPGFVVLSLLTGLLWGAVQEFLYRGWLQTELTRRFGSVSGLLLANLAFTFGPLHANYWRSGDVRWGGLVVIFAIGLVFGLLFRRSGNLWIPALLHGIWPLNMS